MIPDAERRRFRVIAEGDRGIASRVFGARGAGGATIVEVGTSRRALSLTVTPTGEWRLEARDALGRTATVASGRIPDSG